MWLAIIQSGSSWYWTLQSFEQNICQQWMNFKEVQITLIFLRICCGKKKSCSLITVCFVIILFQGLRFKKAHVTHPEVRVPWWFNLFPAFFPPRPGSEQERTLGTKLWVILFCYLKLNLLMTVKLMFVAECHINTTRKAVIVNCLDSSFLVKFCFFLSWTFQSP